MNTILIVSLLIIGFALLAVEILVTPGLTVFGLLGILVLAIGIYYAFIALPLIYAWIILFSSIAIVTAFTIWFFKSGINKGLALKARESMSFGFKPFKKEYHQYLGKKGVSLSPLRPAGMIKINDDKLSAVSQGEFIDSNEKIKVIRVEGNKLVVQKLTF